MTPVATLDPDVVIVARGVTDEVPWLRYRRVSDDTEWTVRGTCNQCGLCVIGTAVPERYEWDGPVGTPLAVRDLLYATRLDEPVTAGFSEDMEQMAREIGAAVGCSLTVEV
jgi:rRNA maturation protein Nop10